MNPSRSRIAPPPPPGSPIEGGEVGAVIRDEHGEQLRGLARAGVLAHYVMGARTFEEAFPRTVDTCRSFVDLGANFARYHVGEHDAGVMMWARLSPRCIVDRNGRQRFPGDVRQLLREYHLNLVSGRDR